MNFKKTINVLLILVVSIVCIFVFYRIHEKNKKNSLIAKEIIQCHENNSKIDLNIIEIYDENSINSAEEYLAVAYYKLDNEEKEAAIELLKKSVSNFGGKTEFAVKYVALDLLTSTLLEQEDNEEALKYLLKIKELSYKELNEQPSSIKALLNKVINVNGGREVIIDILEYIMARPNKLKDEVKSSYANSLGMIFAMSGEYSQGIEILLQSIGDLDNIDGELYELKSIVEIGNIYSSLGQIAEAEKVYKQVIDINLENEKIVNLIMVYAYVNLYEMLIFQEKYEEFFEIAYEIEKYSEDVDEVFFKSSLRVRDISIAHAYICMSEPAKGYSILQEIHQHEKSTYVDDDIYTNIVLGDYYYQIGEYEEAFQLYESMYVSRIGLLSTRYEQMLLVRMIKASANLGDTASELKYRIILSDLYEESIQIISQDYITYIVKKYASEQKLKEASNDKGKITTFTIVIIFMTMFVVSKLIKAMKKNNIDELTGVYNRKKFDEVFDNKFKHKDDFYTIIYDIDDFKRINDTYGHAFGDEVIKEIAHIAVECSKNYGQVFRYGGEEFVVILDNYDKEKIIEIAESIRNKVARKKWNEEVLITISLGVSSKLDNKEATFERADNNLYLSKNSGKNKTTY